MWHQGHGNHWQGIFDDDALMQHWLPVILEQGRLIEARPEGTPAPGTTLGIAWPDLPLCGLSLVSAAPDQAGSRMVLFSAYPFAAKGTRRRLLVDQIIPWGEGAEAWIKTSSPDGGPGLTFFDTRFYANRDRLSVGLEAEFILAGLAYFAEVAHPEPILITKPETIRAMRAGTERADDPSPIEVHMAGGATLFPRDQYAPDEYEFQGPVKRVETFELFDRHFTRLTLTVARLLEPNDADIDLDIYLGDHVWRSNERPLPGADVRGIFWLQGCLAA